MFFEIKDKTYGVKFSRHEKTTLAELIEVAEDGTLVHTGVFGTATPHYTDRFEKRIGRKVALTNLLYLLEWQFSDENEGDLIYPLRLTKEDRTVIWAEYFESHKK